MATVLDYSDLEVGQSPRKPEESYSTLQVNKPNLTQWDTKKELARPYDPLDASAPEKVEEYLTTDSHYTPKSAPTICGLRRKTFWLIFVLSIVVVAAIIGGAIGGTVGQDHQDHQKATSSLNSSLPESAPDVPSASQLLESTTLATAAWNDTSGTLQQRLYVQANDNNIWELSWNSEAKRWATSSETVAQAKPGSPLAAAVAYKGHTNQLNLYYINNVGELMQMNTTDYKQWDTNPVRTSTGAVAKPANDSSLTATWYRYTLCADCSYNAFVAYRDSASGKFQVVNASTSGEVQHITLPSNPLPGSASTFNLLWRSATLANLRLGYQLESGQIASTVWNGTANTWKASETSDQTGQYSTTSLRAPLTSFNFGSGAPAAVPDYLFVLSSGKNGVAVDWWDNHDRNSAHWGTPQSPAVMQRVRSLSPIAANGAGHVFAFEDGVVKEFTVEADGTTWTLVGSVTGN
ncbi:MAG: hypothetical protein Q9225_004368 [Loekoesia sp. 1 TL-2023]